MAVQLPCVLQARTAGSVLTIFRSVPIGYGDEQSCTLITLTLLCMLPTPFKGANIFYEQSQHLGFLILHKVSRYKFSINFDSRFPVSQARSCESPNMLFTLFTGNGRYAVMRCLLHIFLCPIASYFCRPLKVAQFTLPSTIGLPEIFACNYVLIKTCISASFVH